MDKRDSGDEGFVAIVLAGDRTTTDPVAEDAGTSCKAVAPVHGTPMILRVIRALEDSAVVKAIVLCGPPEKALRECEDLANVIEQKNIRRLDSLESPSRSVEAALDYLGDADRVLLTTADHALLSGEIVRYFAEQARESGADMNVGLIRHETVRDAYPEVNRTVISLSDGDYCGCNLFAFMNHNGRKLVPFWRQVEQQRKKPVFMIAGILGIRGVLLYLLHRLSLKAALQSISGKLSVCIKPVVLPFATAGIDVDTVKDRVLVEKILSMQENRRPAS